MDDLLITGDGEKEVKGVKDYLHGIFTIKDLGYTRYFLGLEIIRDRNGTYMNQRKYIMDNLSDTGLLGFKPVHTPLPKGLKLISDQGDSLADPNSCRRLIGRLLYLNFTRLDVTHAVQHWDAGKVQARLVSLVLSVFCFMYGSNQQYIRRQIL